MSSQFAVITPSYRPDLALFADLHESVLRHTGPDTVHHVIVPASDEGLFARFGGPRCHVHTYPQLLPRRYAAVPGASVWVNVRRPWPPVRGWVAQQALKIAAAGMMRTQAVLLADSDVVLVRATAADHFMVDGRPLLYSVVDGVHDGMARHLLWHEAARRLLGLPPRAAAPLPDYVSAFNVWEPAIVRAMQARIEAVSGRSWLDAFCAELHVSEFILYGVFVDEIHSTTAGAGPRSESMLCHTYWDTEPLDPTAATAFAAAIRPDDVAMMISAKSHTSREARDAAQRVFGTRDPERRT